MFKKRGSSCCVLLIEIINSLAFSLWKEDNDVAHYIYIYTILYIYIYYDLQNKDQQIIIISRSLTQMTYPKRDVNFLLYISSVTYIDKNIALDSHGM